MTRLIDAEALKKAINTYDKFACLPDTTLVSFRVLNEPEKNYEPYVHLRDIRNAIDNAPTVDVISNEEGYEMYGKGYLQGYERGKNERPQGEWTPCAERLPDRNDTDYVLVTVSMPDRPYDIILLPTNCVEQEYKKNHISAWQPLPEPYQKGGAE